VGDAIGAIASMFLPGWRFAAVLHEVMSGSGHAGRVTLPARVMYGGGAADDVAVIVAHGLVDYEGGGAELFWKVWLRGWGLGT